MTGSEESKAKTPYTIHYRTKCLNKTKKSSDKDTKDDAAALSIITIQSSRAMCNACVCVLCLNYLIHFSFCKRVSAPRATHTSKAFHISRIGFGLDENSFNTHWSRFNDNYDALDYSVVANTEIYRYSCIASLSHPSRSSRNCLLYLVKATHNNKHPQQNGLVL